MLEEWKKRKRKTKRWGRKRRKEEKELQPWELVDGLTQKEIEDDLLILDPYRRKAIIRLPTRKAFI